MSKISKKYFGPDQVDGSILRLEKDQAVRGKKQDGSEVSLFSLDINDNPVVLGSRVSLKSEVDSLSSDFQSHLIEYSGEKAKISQLQSDMDAAELSISNESIRAQGEENSIKGRLDLVEPKVMQLQTDMDAAELAISNESIRAQGEENSIKGRLDLVEPKVMQLQSDMDAAELSISNESIRAQGEENSIKGRLDLVEPKVMQLQSDMDAAELSISNESIRAQGEENSIKGRLDLVEPKVTQLQSDMDAAELSISNESIRAQGEENTIKGRLDTVEPKVTQLQTDMDAAELSISNETIRAQGEENSLKGRMTTAEADIVDLQAYDLDLRNDLDQEISDRAAADTAKLVEAKAYTDSKISAIPATDLSGYYTKSQVYNKTEVDAGFQQVEDWQAQEILDRNSADAAKLVEAKAYTDSKFASIVDGPSFGQYSAVVGATTSSFMLDKSVKGVMSCSNGRVALHEGYDFTVSVDSGTGFSKLTFIGPSAAGGSEAIESTDQIFVVYAF